MNFNQFRSPKFITIKNIFYVDMVRQTNANSNTQAEAPSADIKGMIEMLNQIRQHDSH